MPFFSLAPCFATFSLWHAQKWKVWDFWTRKWPFFLILFFIFCAFPFFFFLIFLLQRLILYWAFFQFKTFWESIMKRGKFYNGVATCSWRQFCSSFTSNFWVFSWIFQAPLSGSLWSDKIIANVISWCRTWVQMMPILVKGDDVRSETKANVVTVGPELNGLSKDFTLPCQKHLWQDSMMLRCMVLKSLFEKFSDICWCSRNLSYICYMYCGEPRPWARGREGGGQFCWPWQLSCPNDFSSFCGFFLFYSQ